MTAVKLIIFDCDGVLVDSETIANTVLAEHLSSLGLPTTFEQSIQRYMGRSIRSCCEEIGQALGRPFTEDDFADVQQMTFARFRAELKAIDGVDTLLASLSIPFCVASSGNKDKMAVTLGVTGLNRFFQDNIFSASQVERGKPHPDLFLFAAEQMGVAPEHCVVIEDSVPGVKAGVAAGMRVFGYSCMTPAATLAEHGAQPFDSMSALPRLLEIDV